VTGLFWPEPHNKWNLGYWSREGQKRVVDTRRKIIELRTTTTITFHWIKGHAGLKGNERADYLAKTVLSYYPNITYDAIPVSRGKQLLEDYYTQIWASLTQQTTHSFHLTQKVPLPLVHPHPHPTLNKPRLFSLIPP